jgi:predicted exporter
MKKLLRPAIVIWLVFLLLCVFLINNAQFTADMSAFLPRDPSPRQQILIDQINEGFASKTLIISIENAPAKVLAQLSNIVGQQLRQSKLFAHANNGQSVTNDQDSALLFKYRYLLSPAVTPERMSINGLREAVNNSLLEVSSSTGLFSKSLLVSDPTGELLEVLKRVIPSVQPTMVEGVWMNASNTRALLVAQTHAQGSDLDAQEQAHHTITQAFKKAQTTLGAQAESATVLFTGPGVFAVHARNTIRTEAVRLSTLGTVLVLSLLLLVYRSVTTLCLGIVPVATGAIAGVTVVSLGFPAVHAMTLGFGITLIGETVDYAIYLFMQHVPASLQAGPETKEHGFAFSASFWPTIRLGVLTSVFGFSALLFSGFTGLAQLGLFSITGIITAVITTRYVLPLLLPRNFQVHTPARLGVVLSKCLVFLKKSKWLVAAITAAAVLVLASQYQTLWHDSLSSLSPVPEAAQKLDTDLRGEFGTLDASALIVVKAANEQAALEYSELVASLLNPLVEKEQLQGYDAASNYLPSLKTQRARQLSLPSEAELQERTDKALQGLPIQAEKLAAFYSAVGQAKTSSLLIRADFEGSTLSMGINALLMENKKSVKPWTALITLRPAVKKGVPMPLDHQAVEMVLSQLPPQLKSDIYLIELKKEADSMYAAYLKEALILTITGLFAIIILLLISTRSWRRTARVVLPLFAAVAVVAAGLVLTTAGLNLLHLISFLLIFAVGSNYALFFDQRAYASNAQEITVTDSNMLRSLFFANITTVIGFGILAFSSVPVMSAIGLTVGAGALLALLFSAALSADPA